MKQLVVLVAAALVFLSACNIVPAAVAPAPTSTPIPPTPTPLPNLAERFGDRQLILDKLIVQGIEVVIPQGVTANITFTRDGKAAGSGGCNRFTGGYENPAAGQLKFGPLASTKMFCQDKMDVESALFQVLSKINRFKIDTIRLILESEDGQYLASFHDLVK